MIDITGKFSSSDLVGLSTTEDGESIHIYLPRDTNKLVYVIGYQAIEADDYTVKQECKQIIYE